MTTLTAIELRREFLSLVLRGYEKSARVAFGGNEQKNFSWVEFYHPRTGDQIHWYPDTEFVVRSNGSYNGGASAPTVAQAKTQLQADGEAFWLAYQRGEITPH